MTITVTIDLGNSTVPDLLTQVGALIVATAQQFTDLIGQLKANTDSLNASATSLSTAIADLESKIGSTGNTGMTAEEEDAALAQLQDLKAAQDSAKATLDAAVASANAGGVTPAPAPTPGPAVPPDSTGLLTSASPGSTSNVTTPHQGP